MVELEITEHEYSDDITGNIMITITDEEADKLFTAIFDNPNPMARNFLLDQIFP